MSFIDRLVSLVRQRRLDRDLQDEIRAHLEMRAEDNVAEGMAEEDARHDAMRRFGNPALIEEATRAEHIVGWLETLWQDLRYALRVMSKKPGFSAMAILIVALGIGAGTTLFSITDTALRTGLFGPISDRWVLLRAFFPQRNQRVFHFSIREFEELHAQSQMFEAVAFIGGSPCSITSDSPETLDCTHVTANAIPMTGVHPLIGRAITPEEDVPGGAKVAVLSYELWQRRFRGDPHVLGTAIKLDSESYTVVGVMPPHYDLWGGDLWVPYQLHLPDTGSDDRLARVVGLIRKGLTEQQVNARLQDVAQRMARDHAATNPEYQGMTLTVWNVHEAVVGGVKPALMILLAAVGMLILVSCANLGSLLLARASTRRREMAVRAALGASRTRILRQLIVESLALSFLGGTLGVLLALLGVPLAVSLVPQLPNAGQASLTGSALAAALAIAFAMGILFGIAPAFYGARTNLTEAFKEGAAQAGLGRSSHVVRNSLVASEIALSLVILASAVLMIRTYWQLTRLDTGYRGRDLFTMEVSLPDSRYPNPRDLTEFYRQLAPKLSALPGVQAAAVVSGHPLLDRITDAATQNFELEGKRGEKNTANANIRVITPNYFRVTGTRLLSGRTFTDLDDADADHANVVIINKTMARLFWPKQNPIGTRIWLGALSGQAMAMAPESSSWATIVGVVDDAKQIRIIDAPVRQEMFFPLLQRGALRGMTLMLHSAQESAAVTDAVRHTIQGMDPELPIDLVLSIEQLVSNSFGPKRLTTVLLVFFAVAGLTLVVVGLYSVMAFAVTQRTREIGVRMALGAQRSNILRMMLRQGLRLGLAGLIAGLAASLGATQVLRSLFVDMDPFDPLTLAAVSAGLALVILLATYVPALRATKVDPMVALRQE
jgi:putative ABC transport system permease protein